MLQALKNFSEKIKYGARLLNWFADSLASLPLPPVPEAGRKPDNNEHTAKLPATDGTGVPGEQVQKTA